MRTNVVAMAIAHQLRDGWTAELLRHRVRVLLASIIWLTVVTALLCCSAWAQALAAGISANPTTIIVGGSSTLTWNTINRVSANLNATPVALNGSMVVSRRRPRTESPEPIRQALPTGARSRLG